MYEFDVVILEDETGGYAAFVPNLPGCHTQGENLEELMENVREAIELYLETLTDEEKEEALKQRMVGIQRGRTPTVIKSEPALNRAMHGSP